MSSAPVLSASVDSSAEKVSIVSVFAAFEVLGVGLIEMAHVCAVTSGTAQQGTVKASQSVLQTIRDVPVAPTQAQRFFLKF